MNSQLTRPETPKVTRFKLGFKIRTYGGLLTLFLIGGGALVLIAMLLSGIQSPKDTTPQWSWHSVTGNDARAESPHFLMFHQNGDIKVSAEIINFRLRDWELGMPPGLHSVRQHGIDGFDVLMEDGRVFTVGVEQPFVFAQNREYTYLVRDDMSIWRAVTDDLETLK